MPIRFNSSGDYARRTTNLPSLTNFTMCGWIKRKATQSGAWRYYAGLEDATASASSYVLLGWTSGDAHQLSTDGGTDNSTNQPVVDEWWFFYIKSNADPDTFDAGLGEEGNSTMTETMQVPNSGVTFTPAVLNLGSDSWNEWVDCEIAHVRVWDAILTATELNAELQSLTPVRSSNLRMYWPLADSTDTGDDSGNGYDLTFNGVADGGADPAVGGTTEALSSIIQSKPQTSFKLAVTKAAKSIVKSTEQDVLKLSTTKGLATPIAESANQKDVLWILQQLQPSSDDDQGSWLPSDGGDLYAMVDENVPSDTDYIYLED